MLSLPTRTRDVTMDELVARLSARDEVDGLLLTGSASQGKRTLTAAGDYDLVVILAAMPAPLHVGLTVVDGRLTDLLFASVDEIEHILALAGPVDGDEWVGKLIRWIRGGTILYDRGGRLVRARQKVQVGDWLLPAGEDRVYRTWSSISFNVRHNRRMLASDDPVYERALDARMLYSLFDVFLGYFSVRGLPCEGEKAQVRYLAANDPGFLSLFGEVLAEQDRGRKVALYEELAALALAPVGGLCPDDATSIGLRPGAASNPGAIGGALAFWDYLVQGEQLL